MAARIFYWSSPVTCTFASHDTYVLHLPLTYISSIALFRGIHGTTASCYIVGIGFN